MRDENVHWKCIALPYHELDRTNKYYLLTEKNSLQQHNFPANIHMQQRAFNKYKLC